MTNGCTNADGEAVARGTAVIVLMGVTGAGKTTVGRALAATLGWEFVDADDLHPASNVEKMSAGAPLTDADRAPWLESLRALIARHLATHTPLVLACSALRAWYREELHPPGAPRDAVRFVYLALSPALAESRLEQRDDHFMPASLVESQFATLEEPRDAIRIDASQPVDRIVARVRDQVGV